MASNDDPAQDSDATSQEEAATWSADQPLPLATQRRSVRSASASEVVGTATRRAFRDLAAKLRREVVQDLWADAGFSPPSTHLRRSVLSAAPAGKLGYVVAVLESLAALGETQSLDREFGPSGALFERYARAVDWTDVNEVARALRVFAGVLREHRRRPGWSSRPWPAWVSAPLHDDGYVIDEQDRILSIGISLPPGALADLRDSSAIRLGLERVNRALGDPRYPDPAAAIGAAKELVESTCKLVLHERGRTINPNMDLPALVQAAAGVLYLHPAQHRSARDIDHAGGHPDQAGEWVRLFGRLCAIPQDLANIRNRGWGTGHGGVTAPAGLAPRHARLAVTAATAWINFMLETLVDSTAGWRVADSDAAPSPGTSEQPSRRAEADDHGRSRRGGCEHQAADQQTGTDS
ncbi:abortive infection family protein [Micromonospora echinofusca]|uniref:abortive infection family protein n=1 Tax=Micromonospora echinofusca TaxID=47858 RepID=UPI0033CA4BE0